MQVEQGSDEPRATFTDVLRRFQYLLDPIAERLNRLKIQPNTLTLAGLTGNLIGAIFIADGRLTVGGLLILFMGPVDALDGAMARLRGEPTEFGAFVDSVTDRYSELVIFLGLLVYYLRGGDTLLALLVFSAAAGSVLVSYVRARGEALGYRVKGGLLTRVERYMVLAPTLLFGIPAIGVAIIAILANLTALQRVLLVRAQARVQIGAKPDVG